MRNRYKFGCSKCDSVYVYEVAHTEGGDGRLLMYFGKVFWSTNKEMASQSWDGMTIAFLSQHVNTCESWEMRRESFVVVGFSDTEFGTVCSPP